MVTVTDMTTPSAPGRAHTMTIASDDYAELIEELTLSTRNRIADVLAGELCSGCGGPAHPDGDDLCVFSDVDDA